MGILISTIIMALWGIHLFYSLTSINVDFQDPLVYAHVIIQAYLYTGLFITGHDAMHRVVCKNRIINDCFGRASAFLFAGLSYKRLRKNHFLHHKYPCTEKDPDYLMSSQNFFAWYLVFMYRYATILQLIIMAVLFNVLKIFFPEVNIWMFWVIPAILGSLQLFFFGTYVPHKRPHTETMLPHNARTQHKNHLWAMLSCYFFGYHYEHHDAPHIPWWQLYKTK